MEKKITAWLSSEALNGKPINRSSTSLADTNWERAYEIWEHAEEILRGYPDDSYLGDVIANLKRAVIHRTNHLMEVYALNKTPIKEQPRKALERLEYWGIIRPTMLRRLIDVRNAIEHEDAPAPDRERCFEFLDFVWYFLRSTDSLSKTMMEEFELSGSGEHDLVLTFHPNSDWKIELFGRLSSPSSLLSMTEVSDWIRVEVRLEPYKEILQRRHGNTPEEEKRAEFDDVLVDGQILGPEQQLKRIILRYFAV
jgi:hypothetical protein